MTSCLNMRHHATQKGDTLTLGTLSTSQYNQQQKFKSQPNFDIPTTLPTWTERSIKIFSQNSFCTLRRCGRWRSAGPGHDAWGELHTLARVVTCAIVVGTRSLCVWRSVRYRYIADGGYLIGSFSRLVGWLICAAKKWLRCCNIWQRLAAEVGRYVNYFLRASSHRGWSSRMSMLRLIMSISFNFLLLLGRERRK